MTDRNINKIARLDIPTLRMEELVIGKKYRVTELKSSDTKYGKKVLYAPWYPVLTPLYPASHV